MKEETYCPHCDELTEFDFADDYYFTEQGEEIEVCICSNCNNKVSISWEFSHTFNVGKA